MINLTDQMRTKVVSEDSNVRNLFLHLNHKLVLEYQECMSRANEKLSHVSLQHVYERTSL